jgi:hypothetical protein
VVRAGRAGQCLGDSTVSFLVKGNFLETSVPCAHAIPDYVYASLSGMLQMHRSR